MRILKLDHLDTTDPDNELIIELAELEDTFEDIPAGERVANLRSEGLLVHGVTLTRGQLQKLARVIERTIKALQ